jgi:hypothetical protein
MSASTLAAIATLQVIFFREHNIPFFAQIKIFFVKLISKGHRYKLRINPNVRILELS